MRQRSQISHPRLPDRSGRDPPSLDRQRTNHRILPGILHRYGQGRHFQNRLRLLRHVGTLSETHPRTLLRGADILDRFHIVANMNKALDNVRAEETSRMKREGRAPVLRKSRWLLLRRSESLGTDQHFRLRDLLRYNLKTVRAYLLKEAFQQLWEYNSPVWAGKFLDEWCRQTMRSRIEPMKKIARSLRNHRELILNYFRAQKLLSSGVVEGLNNKAKVTMRRSYGFRTYRVLELALYHSLGKLPEPESTHDFF